jgi:hypothetical protein
MIIFLETGLGGQSLRRLRFGSDGDGSLAIGDGRQDHVCRQAFKVVGFLIAIESDIRAHDLCGLARTSEKRCPCSFSTIDCFSLAMRAFSIIYKIITYNFPNPPLVPINQSSSSTQMLSFLPTTSMM